MDVSVNSINQFHVLVRNNQSKPFKNIELDSDISKCKKL